MEIRELSRNESVLKYKAEGCAVKGKRLKGKEYKKELYSLFLSRYKQTLDCNNPQKLVVIYADMLEVLQSLMKMTNTKFKNNLADPKRQAMQWYKDLAPTNSKNKLTEARIDLMQKFYELIPMRTEAVRDHLNEMVEALRNLVECHKLSFETKVDREKVSFVSVNEMNKKIHEKLGGFDKGVYIESVSKIKTANLSA